MIKVLKIYSDLVTNVRMVTCEGKNSTFDITWEELMELKKMGWKIVYEKEEKL